MMCQIQTCTYATPSGNPLQARALIAFVCLQLLLSINLYAVPITIYRRHMDTTEKTTAQTETAEITTAKKPTKKMSINQSTLLFFVTVAAILGVFIYMSGQHNSAPTMNGQTKHMLSRHMQSRRSFGEPPRHGDGYYRDTR